jgi:sugar phosphate isomerase/epimerase
MSSRTWTLDQDLRLYRTLDVKAATVPFRKVATDPGAAARAFVEAGVRPVLLGGDAATPFVRGLDVLASAIDAAYALSCPAFYTVSGASPERGSTDDAFLALVDQLAPVVAYARSKGVRLAIENNSIATRGHGFIHTLADAADLARAADLDICLELQNSWYERRLPQLFRENIRRILMVQISDFVVGEDLRLNRRVPGDGSMPLEWMLRALLDAGYEGLFDIEILGPSIESEGYASAIGRSIDWLSERLTRWGL